MASIYKEGGAWSARVRMEGQSHFKGGFKTQAAAKGWAREIEMAIAKQHKPKGMGTATALAFALRDYVNECVVYHKGCKAELARINPYLESAGLPVLSAQPVDSEPAEGKLRRFVVSEQPRHEKTLPRTFEVYRQDRLAKRPKTAEQRAQLAVMPVGQIASYHIKALRNAMMDDGFTASSINNELSILSALFTNAIKAWKWPLLENPVDNVERPVIDNERDRVLGADEEKRLAEALSECKNPYVTPYVYLAIETTMRKSEILLTARWEDVDWDKRLLALGDAKAGRRKVPLTAEAVAVLKAMPNFGQGGRIFLLSLDALYSAWRRACERAGITNLHIHDLRHTGTTRHAKRFNGDIFLLKLVTGHKSLSMLQRYVNLTPEDAVAAFDKTAPAVCTNPPVVARPTEPAPPAVTQVASEAPSNVIAFNAWRQRSA